MDFVKKHRYRFVHLRKGQFEGIFLGKEEAEPEDGYDTEFWTIAMDTSDGSGSEWLRRAAGAQSTITNIRPSLVESVEEVEDDGRLAAAQE
jgi:hypothetical protein